MMAAKQLSGEKEQPVFQDLSRFSNKLAMRGRSAFTVQIWWIVQALLFNASPQAMFGWRRWLLRRFGSEIGANVKLRSSLKVVYPWNLRIGVNCWIGDDVRLYCLDKIEIGDNCVVSQQTYICTGSHNYNLPSFDLITEPVKLEDQCWVASDCFVMPGTTIGRGAVVAARSLVTRSVPRGSIVAGSPAKTVGYRASQ